MGSTGPAASLRPWRRALSMAVVTAVAAVALGAAAVVADSSAEVSAYTGYGSTLNLCGAACHDQPTDPQYRIQWGHELLHFLTGSDNPRPWSVAAQEVCDIQHLYLANAFAPLGYTGQFIITRPNVGTCPNDGNYGMSLFTVGANIGPELNHRYAKTSYANDTFPAEQRRLGCQQKQGWGFDWWACVTHLVPNSSGHQPWEQAGEAAFITHGLARFMVAGDFNLNPPVSYWPAGWDADRSLLPLYQPQDTAAFSSPADTALEHKFDYVYSPTSWFASRVASTSCSTVAARASTAAYTDHCFLRGTMWN